MFKKLNITLLEILGIALFISFFILVQWYKQPLVHVNQGLGWDGVEYSKIFDNFDKQTHSKVIFPFCNRILTPYMAFLIHCRSTIFSFKILNIFFSFAFSILIYVIAKKVSFNRIYAFIALFLSLILFFSPARFLFFYPVYTDPGFLFLLSLSFLCLICRSYFLSILVLIIAYPIREASIYLLPVFFIFSVVLEKFKWRFVGFLMLGLVACLVLKIFIATRFDCHGNQLITGLFNGFYKLNNPQSFIKCLAGLLMTMGPLVNCDFHNHVSKIDRISFIGLIYAIFLAIVGGGDTTRIFYSFFPIYFILIISCLQKKGISYTLISGAAYLCTNQVLVRIQEPLNSWPTRDEYTGYFNQFPDYAPLNVSVCIILSWYILLHYSIFFESIFKIMFDKIKIKIWS